MGLLFEYFMSDMHGGVFDKKKKDTSPSNISYVTETSDA